MSGRVPHRFVVLIFGARIVCSTCRFHASLGLDREVPYVIRPHGRLRMTLSADVLTQLAADSMRPKHPANKSTQYCGSVSRLTSTHDRNFENFPAWYRRKKCAKCATKQMPWWLCHWSANMKTISDEDKMVLTRECRYNHKGMIRSIWQTVNLQRNWTISFKH